MDIKVPNDVDLIINRFNKAGFEIYIVGGVVRDLILGRELNDWDFTTNATPEEILNLYPDGFYDNKFGTVGIDSGGDRPYEITTFRTESDYSDNRHPNKISWGKTIEEDLQRRDFTINSLAFDSDLKLIDLHGGQSDLKNKIIRAVGNPDDRFKEDALRMMRAVRIAAQLGFIIEDKTLTAIRNNAKLLYNISAERVRDELLKLMASPYPADGYMLLKNSGIASEILPEMDTTFGIQQKSPGRHHVYDVGTHCVESLRHCPSPEPITRLATLIHDVGKVKTQKIFPNGQITFYNHEMESAKTAKNISERLRFSNAQADKFIKLVRWHQFTMDEKITDSAVRRIITNVGKENVSDLIALRIGDRIGSGARETSWRFELLKNRFEEVQQQPFSIPDLKISGHDVMKIKNVPSGPEVGKYLQILFDEVVENGLENEREELIKKLGSL